MFHHYVLTRNVGDDNVNGVTTEAAKKFNMVTIQREMLRLGYVTTPAKKGSEVVPTIPFSELTFVKRSFVFSRELNMFVAPIEKDSIYKAFCYERNNMAVTSVQRLIDVANGAQREAFLHGREFFANFQKELNEGMGDLPYVILNYDSLLEEYSSGVFKTFMMGGLDVEKAGIVELGETESVMHGGYNKLRKSTVGTTTLRSEIDFLQFPRPDRGACVLRTVAEFNQNNSTEVVSQDGETRFAVADISSTNASFPRSSGVSKATDFPQFVEHFAQIDHRIVNSTTVATATVSTDLVKTYRTIVASSPLGRKLDNFSYSTAHVKVRIAVQGAAFAAGKIVVTFRPAIVWNPEFQVVAGIPPSKGNWTTLPHICIDPSKTQTYEIDLPVCTPTGAWNFKSLIEQGSYAMYIQYINPLTSGTATAPSIAMCTYVGLGSSSLEGITMLGNDFEEEKKGTVSSALLKTGEVAGGVADAISGFFPGIGLGVSLFSQVSSSVGAGLKFLGFAKPPDVETTSVPLIRHVDNWSQFDGKSTAIVLAGSQKTSLGLSPQYGGGEEQQMVLSEICKNFGMIDAPTKLNPASPAGTLVKRFYVNPVYHWSGSIPPLTGVALPFRFWCGDLTYRFEFIASVFHRATVLIAWDALPTFGALSGSQTMEGMMQTLPNTVVTISGNTVVDVTIPWKQAWPWGTVRTPYVTGTNPSTWNGEIFVWIINPVTSNGSVDGIDMNVYVNSSNIVFAQPSASRLGDYYHVPLGLMEDIGEDPIKEEKVETEELSSGWHDASPAAPVTEISFGPKTDLSHHLLRSFGEKHDTVKHVTSKMSLQSTATYTASSLETTAMIEWPVQNIPKPYFGMRLDVPAATPGDAFSKQTYLGWFTAAYVGYRGSIRRSFFPMQYGTASPVSVIGANHWLANDTEPHVKEVQPVTRILPGNSHGYFFRKYAFTGAHREVCPTVDGVVSSIFPIDFVYQNVQSRVSNFCYYRYMAERNNTTESDSTWIHMNVASGDDASFVWFIGFPDLGADWPTIT